MPIDSSRPRPPAGSVARAPYSSTTDAPAAAARAAAGTGDAPIGTRAARPATRLRPERVKKSVMRGAVRRVPPSVPRGSGDLEVEPPGGAHDARDRGRAVEQRGQPGAHDDARTVRARPRVHRADRERRGRSARAGDVAVACARVAVVPRRRDDERVERQRSLRGARLGPVGEAGERLGERDERDAGRVVRVAVVVRVDGAVEPGDQLVAARVDGPVPEGVGLPAGDADRQDGGAGGDAGEAGRPAAADEQAGHLRAVALDLRRVVGLRGRERVRVAPDHVDALLDAPAQIGDGGVDAGVEEGDRHAPAVDAREGDVRAVAGQRAEVVAREDLRRDRGRVGDAHRVDAGDVLVAFDDRDDARIDERGETVEHAGEAEVGAHLHSLQREPRDEELLRRERRVCPGSLLPRADDPAGGGDALRERRGAQDDDDPLADRDARSRADEPAPVGRARRRLRKLPRALPLRGEQHDGCSRGDERQQQCMPRLSARRTHPGQDNPDTGRGP